ARTEEGGSQDARQEVELLPGCNAKAGDINPRQCFFGDLARIEGEDLHILSWHSGLAALLTAAIDATAGGDEFAVGVDARALVKIVLERRLAQCTPPHGEAGLDLAFGQPALARVVIAQISVNRVRK